jgi:LacI family transcriptional regulator
MGQNNVKRAGKPNAFATIYDIARRAGVSKSTVSRVLTNNKSVDPQTRERVLKAVKDLRYSPNRAARNLSTRSETRIGLVYSNPSAAYFTELLFGALEGSSRNSAHLTVERCRAGNRDVVYESVRSLVAGGLNGMILATPLSEEVALIRELQEKGISVVGVATSGARTDVSCVDIDNYTAAYEMMTYLIRLGHKRVGFVKGHPDVVSSKIRFQGVKAALKNAGGKVAQSVFVQGYNDYRSGMVAADEILSSGSKVTAIFANNDDMAAGVMSMAHRKGLSVPQDISVVGFDDTIAGTVWPELTTVRQPIAEIGRLAVDILVANIRRVRAGDPPLIKNHLIAHKLVVRESTASPP